MLDRDKEPLEKVMSEFLGFIGELRLVFYNAPFDMSFLTRAARQVSRDIRNPVSDALDMARRAFPGMPSYKLSELAKAQAASTQMGRIVR
jgi:DNA polymerase III epsilon subunit-like protein